MKENGVVRRRLSGKEADPYIGQARKILGEMKNIMRLGGIKQLSWTKDLADGVRVTVMSIFGQDTVRISVPKYIEKIDRKDVTVPSNLTATMWICRSKAYSPIDSVVMELEEWTPVGFTGKKYTLPANIYFPAYFMFVAAYGKLWFPDKMVNTSSKEETILGTKSTVARITVVPQGVLYVTYVNSQSKGYISLYSSNGDIIYSNVIVSSPLGGYIGPEQTLCNNGEFAFLICSGTSSSGRGLAIIEIKSGESTWHPLPLETDSMSGLSVVEDDLYLATITDDLYTENWEIKLTQRVAKSSFSEGMTTIESIKSLAEMNNVALPMTRARNGGILVSTSTDIVLFDTKTNTIKTRIPHNRTVSYFNSISVGNGNFAWGDNLLWFLNRDKQAIESINFETEEIKTYSMPFGTDFLISFATQYTLPETANKSDETAEWKLAGVSAINSGLGSSV